MNSLGYAQDSTIPSGDGEGSSGIIDDGDTGDSGDVPDGDVSDGDSGDASDGSVDDGSDTGTDGDDGDASDGSNDGGDVLDVPQEQLVDGESESGDSEDDGAADGDDSDASGDSEDGVNDDGNETEDDSVNDNENYFNETESNTDGSYNDYNESEESDSSDGSNEGDAEIPPVSMTSEAPSSGGSSASFEPCTNPAVLYPPASCVYTVEGGEDIYITYRSWVADGRVVLIINGVTFAKGIGSIITTPETIITIQDIDYGNESENDYPEVTISFEPILEEVPEEETEEDVSGKRIIIWNDDIGAWWSVNNAIQITEFIRNKDVPVTLGVIPYTGGGLYELGSDPTLVDYLKSIRNDSDVEIALQGLKFEDSEFAGKTSEEIENKILEGKEIFRNSIYVNPETFMPPYYVHDYNALVGVKDAGMKQFTGGWNVIEAGYGFVQYPEGLFHVPVTTDSFNWDTNDFYPASEIEDACLGAMEEFGTCAIVFQHHTFMDASGNVDSAKLQVLSDVLDWMKEMESQGVILDTVGDHVVLSGSVTPVEPEPEPKKGIIVFRNDDLAAYWSVENAITVSETIRQAGVPQVLSVIPSSSYGYKISDDSELTDYLKSIRDAGYAELALHGENHALNEFQDLSSLSTYYKMSNAVNIYTTTFGETPDTFVPPYNVYNSLASFYAVAMGIKVMSAGATDFTSGTAFTTDRFGLLHIPQTTDVYSWGEGKLYSEEEIESSCQDAINLYGACVIVVHHHVFTDANGNIDPAKLSLLENVVEWAKNKETAGEAEIKMFKDITAAELSS